jgi:hypothetical protein
MFILLFVIGLLILSIDMLLDLTDEFRWQIKFFPARLWHQKYHTHRRYF